MAIIALKFELPLSIWTSLPRQSCLRASLGARVKPMVDAVHGAENFAMRSEISQETQAGATSEGPREGVSVDVLLQWLIPSGVTSKPASRGHLKTGQLSASRTVIVLPHRGHFRQEFFKLNLPSAPNSVYTDLTWAEDRAPQGCAPSADPAAGMAGRRQPPHNRTAILAENAVNPRGLGTASPTEESLLPIWFCSREVERSHIHCGAPAAAVAVFVRQLRGPHLSTCP